jgi:hypothetical protein
MCTYDTTHLPLTQSSAKLPTGWARVAEATVYLDHPVDAPVDHALCIDFRRGAERVAVELDPADARALALAVLSALDRAPVGLLTRR